MKQQYKAYAEEATQIEQMLEKDIDSHKTFFENPKPFHYGLSYKTNTPKSMRFNVLGLMNYMNTELLIGMSCDLENAFDALPKFTAMLQSIEVNE